MKELSPAMIRRLLVVMEGGDYTGDLFWHVNVDGTLGFSANCSDFFEWASADTEPIETREDVRLLEVCLKDLQEAAGESYPLWVTELYSARRRNARPAHYMMSPSSKYFVGEKFVELFERLGE